MTFLRCTGLLLAAAIASLPLAAAGQSATLPGWRAAAQTLFARFESIGGKGGAAPRLSNPGDATLIRSVLDGDAIWAMGSQDFPAIDARCEPVRGLMTRYLLLGTHSVPGQSASPDRIRATAVNWRNYPDELSLSLATATLCGARETEAIGRFMLALSPEQNLASRRRAAIGGRASLAQSVVYIIGMQTEARGYTSPANRRLLLDTVTRVAPTLSPLLSLDERVTVLAAIDAQVRQLPKADGKALSDIRRAFENTECAGFCAMKAG